MLSTTGIVWLMALAATVGALAWRLAPRVRWALQVRRAADPSRDPGAPLVADAEARWARRDAAQPMAIARAWSVALAESTDDEAWRALVTFRREGDEAGEVAVGLTLGHVDGLPWRAWIRELPALDGAHDADAHALAAERHVALGELHEAARQLGEVPPDHWRGCRVRAVLYAMRSDRERAQSARYAAWALAPEEAKPALARQQSPARHTVR